MTLHPQSVATLGVVACFATTSALSAQDTASKVPLKQVAPVEARATRGVTAVSALRALGDGTVFVNDAQRRQMIRFDASLKEARVIADTAPGAPLPYGQRPSQLLSYAGDSTLIVDPSTSALLVLNAQGKVARIIAPPRNNDINTLASTNLGSNAFDSKGQLVYRQGNAGAGGGVAAMFGSGNDRGGRGGGQPQGNQQRGGQPGQQGQQGRGGAGGGGGDFGGGPPGGFGVGGFGGGFGGGPGGGPGGRGNQGAQPDSVPIVRANFDTRAADSVAWVKVPKNETSMTRGEDGGMRFTAKINPLPQGDDWALMSDGTIAVVRVLDYHIDFYTPDGKHEASERLPFDWKRISDEDKIKMVDSLKSMAKAITDRQAAQQGGNQAFRMNFEVTAPEKLPDYYPPIRAGSTLADRDGQLWILPSTSNLSAQIAAQLSAGGPGGRGGFGGAPGGAPGAPGAAGATRAPGDTTGRGGRGGAGGPPGGMGALAGLMPANMPPLVYDVVNRKGQLVHRVQLPAGRQLVGFGANGVIYMAAREGREVFLERSRIAP